MSKPFNKVNGGILPLGLKDKFTFGKYMNMRVVDIMDTDIDYVAFIVNKGLVKLTKEATDSLLLKWSRKIDFPLKTRSKGLDWNPHSDQDDWWEDVPF
jgi:hypothetical protein